MFYVIGLVVILIVDAVKAFFRIGLKMLLGVMKLFLIAAYIPLLFIFEFIKAFFKRGTK